MSGHLGKIGYAFLSVLVSASTTFGATLDDDPLTMEIDIVVEYHTTNSAGQVNMWFLEDTWTTWVDDPNATGTFTSNPHRVTMTLGESHDFWVDKHYVDSVSITARNPEGYTLYIAEHNSDNLLEREQHTNVDAVDQMGIKKFKMMVVKGSADTSVMGIGESATWGSGGVGSMRIGLGTKLNGESAGTLRLGGFNATSSTIDTSALIYATRSEEIDVVPVGGKIRQINAPQGLADIVTINSTSFEIRFYNWSDVGAKSGGLYTLVGSPTPFVKYKVSKPSFWTVAVRKTRGSTYWETLMSIASSYPNPITFYDWAKNSTAGSGSGQSLRYSKYTTITSSGYTYNYHQEYGRPTTSGGFTQSLADYRKYYDYSWGRELLSVKEGSNSNGTSFLRETKYEYYTSSGDGDGNYKQLKKVTRPDGGYTRYVYYNDFDKLGQRRYEYSPFQDTQEGLFKEHLYTSDGTGENYFRSEVITKANSEQIGRVTNEYTSETLYGEPVMKVVTKRYSSAGSKTESIRKTYRETTSEPFLRGRPHSVTREDKTQTSYYYYDAGGTFQIWGYNGTIDAAGESYHPLNNVGGASFEDIKLVNFKSTADVTIVDMAARPYHVYQAVNHSGGSTQWASLTERTYDDATRITKVRRTPYANGSWVNSYTTLYEASYSSIHGMLDWSEDETGERTEYEYDDQGRVNEVIKLGVDGSDGYSATSTIKTKFTFDGSNRLIQEDVSDFGGSETISSTWEYDDAGRMTSRTQDCCDTVDYAYTTTRITQTNDDGGTIIQDFYLDGTLEQRSGTATTPLYRKVFAKSADYLEIWTASQSFTEASPYKDNWSMSRNDWLGRPIHRRTPTDDGGSLVIGFIYNTKGQLTDRTTHSATESGGSLSERLKPYKYTYDAMGRVAMEGLDAGGGGLGTNSSTDRYTRTSNILHRDASGYWWAQTETYQIPSANNEVLALTRRSRIAPSAGELSRTETVDLSGNKETTYAKVVRDDARVTVTSEFDPVPDNDSTVVYKTGLLVKSIDTAGVDTIVAYDDLRRQEQVDGRDAIKNKVSYYTGTRRIKDERQIIVGTSLEHIYKTYAYGDSGRVSRVTRKNTGGDENTYYSYNTRGQITKVYGNGTYPIDYLYDGYGRRTDQIQYRTDSETLESKVKWVYDDVENTGLVIQKRHYKTASTYDDTDFQYSDLGQISRRTWDRGVYTTYGYSNVTGDLLTETHSDTTTPNVSYTRDKMGRLKTVTDYTGTRTFIYDKNSGLSLGKEDLPGFYADTDSLTVDDLQYHYHNTSTTTAIRGSLEYSDFRNADWEESVNAVTGRLNKFVAGYGSSAKQFDVAYDSDSNHVHTITTALDTENYKLERTWESWRENRATSVAHYGDKKRVNFNIPNYEFQYNFEDYTLVNDDDQSLAKQYGAASSTNIKYDFDYDKRGQLTWWDTVGYNFPSQPSFTTYSYDSAGNRTASTDTNGTDTFTVNSLNQIDQGSNINYDADGNLSYYYGWTYQYDANNRVKAMYKTGKRLEFQYDYMGRRVEKKVWNNSSGTGNPADHLKFLYQGMELIAELDANDSDKFLRTYYWGLDKSDSRGGAGGAEGLLMFVDWSNSSKPYYPSYDLNGNMVGLLNATGGWEAWYAYDSFGNVMKQNGPYATENPIGFSTQYTDRETNLVYFGFRFYHPELGRFVNRDPVAEVGGANLYRFVNNNPVSNIDIWGLCIEPLLPIPDPDDDDDYVKPWEWAEYDQAMVDYLRCLEEQEKNPNVPNLPRDGGDDDFGSGTRPPKPLGPVDSDTPWWGEVNRNQTGSEHPFGSPEYNREQRIKNAENRMDKIAERHLDAALTATNDTHLAPNVRVRYQERSFTIGVGTKSGTGFKIYDTVDDIKSRKDLIDDAVKLADDSDWVTYDENIYSTIIRNGSSVDMNRSNQFDVNGGISLELLPLGLGVKIIQKRFDVQTTRWEYNP